jgi:hypothetical protein
MSTGTAPVKYFIGMITGDAGIRERVVHVLAVRFGRPDFIGNWHPFEHTNFYASEMGAGLKKCFVSFEKLLPPEALPDAKIWCGEAEDRFRVDGKRAANLDPGYINYCKLVLASGKYGGHKVCMARGCWADFIMRYSEGKWLPLPWCFPDFASGVYDGDLNEIRRLFKEERRKI